MGAPLRSDGQYRSWAWFGPALLSGVFLVVLGVFLYFLQLRNAAENLRALEADAEAARSAVRARLDADRAFVLTLAEDLSRETLDEVSFQERVSRYALDHPELVHVRWLTPDLKVHRQAPSAPSGRIVGSPVTSGESRRAIRLAILGRLSLWTRPQAGPGGQQIFELWLPIYRDDVPSGLIGAAFSCDGLLRRALPAPIAYDYRLTLEDALGGTIVALPSAGAVDPGLTRVVALDPPGYGVSLRMERYGSRLWGLGMTALAIACVALAIGMAFGMWQLARAIAVRRRAESALRESNEALSALIDASPLAIVVLEVDGRIAMWSRASRELFGWTAEEVVGRPSPIVPPERWAEFLRLQERAVSGGYDAEETTRIRKDGTPVEVRISAAPLRDATGKVRRVVAVIADVTRERLIEERLREVEKMEAVGRLAGGVAHDFNNLLTAILGYSDLLMHRLPEGDRMRQEIGEIRKAGERAAALTRQLLAFGRKQVLQPRRLDLGSVVLEMEPMLSRLVGEDVELAVRAVTGESVVYADRGQVEQAIVNLASNARDAMPEGGRLSISVSPSEAGPPDPVGSPPEGGYVLLSVADSGRGIDESVRVHLFEPFFTTKERGKGTGMGLPTVYGIVKQSGGHIAVESRPGAGTEFRIWLPRIETPAVGPKDLPVPAPEVRVPGGSAGRTILVAEDEGVIRMLVVAILRREGYEVLDAPDGVEALRVADAHPGPIDLLLTDVAMPRMGGKELADRFAARRAGAKILFMSGYPDDALGVRGVLPENTAFLGKPFMPEAVVRKVRDLLAGTAGKGD
jgi:PAS domain S-box-containing protein